MADKRTNDPQDDPISGTADERMRGVGDQDDDFEDADDLDLDDEEEDEEGSTF